MNLPLWLLSPALLLFTSIFFALDHMNYSISEWIIGNGIIGLGILFIYGGEYLWLHNKN